MEKEQAEADAAMTERLGVDPSTVDRVLGGNFDRALGNKSGLGSKASLQSQLKQGGRRRVDA